MTDQGGKASQTILTHLQRREAEAIHIMREVLAEVAALSPAERC